MSERERPTGLKERERERERETNIREEKFETIGSDFEQNWEIGESGSISDKRRAKMVVLDHGVKERPGGGDVMSEGGGARSWS